MPAAIRKRHLYLTMATCNLNKTHVCWSSLHIHTDPQQRLNPAGMAKTITESNQRPLSPPKTLWGIPISCSLSGRIRSGDLLQSSLEAMLPTFILDPPESHYILRKHPEALLSDTPYFLRRQPRPGYYFPLGSIWVDAGPFFLIKGRNLGSRLALEGVWQESYFCHSALIMRCQP